MVGVAAFEETTPESPAAGGDAATRASGAAAGAEVCGRAGARADLGEEAGFKVGSMVVAALGVVPGSASDVATCFTAPLVALATPDFGCEMADAQAGSAAIVAEDAARACEEGDKAAIAACVAPAGTVAVLARPSVAAASELSSGSPSGTAANITRVDVPELICAQGGESAKFWATARDASAGGRVSGNGDV